MSAIDESKTERLSVRIDKDRKETIRKAANILGSGMSDFVVQTAIQKAMDIIEQHNKIVISENDFKAFSEAIQNPGEPNEALKEAKQRHDELIEQ